MSELYSSLISTLSNYLYTYILIVLLVAAGVWFTVRTKFVQFRYLAESLRIVLQPSEDENAVSAFKTAFLGSATAFVEGTLAQIYKKRAEDGSCYGGPSYYIEAVLKQRWLGVLFAVVMILTYMVGFNLVASFNIADSFKVYGFYDPTLTPMIVGGLVAAVFLLCISGGGKQIASVTAVLVPVMGVVYLSVSLFVVVTHITMIPPIFADIFRNAFNFRAIFGGFAGSAIMHGIKRGLFSNEAGIGAAACAAGSAGVSHPAKQGLVQVLSVFIDTIVVCSATAMLLLCSGVAPEAGLAGMPYVQKAMSNMMGEVGVIFITVSLVLFAFTTLLGNYYYAETGMSYLLGGIPPKTVRWIQRLVAVAVVFVGAIAQLNLVWDTSDVKEGKNPEFKAAAAGIREKTDFWN